jgi:3-hydroxyisobutyrate dehydrogenase-like beta-hydroxyacid dehydrogenase
MKKIAVIGIGIMGNGMARNYLKHNYEVFIWNRNMDALTELVKSGATAAHSPKEAAEKADIVFEITATDESSHSVWLGENGILAGADREKTLISCGTFSIEWIDRLSKACAEKGFSFFDMPVTGSRTGAENGTLTLLAGGNEKKLELLKPDLKAISERVMYFGKAGSGIRFKLILNMLFGIHMTGLGEALKIAEATGMDIQKVGDALAEKPGGTTTNLGWQSYQKTPDPINFSVRWITKDLKYAKRLAKALETPLLDKTLEKYEGAVKEGRGDEDWSLGTKL